ARAAIDRHRFPARVLSPLSRLREILPAVGAGALLHSARGERSRAALWHVIARDARGFILAVSGLAIEARIASGPAVRTIAGGGDVAQLTRALDNGVANGAIASIS